MYKSRRIKKVGSDVKQDKLIHLQNSFWYNDIDFITTEIQAVKVIRPIDDKKVMSFAIAQHDVRFDEITLIHLKNGEVLVEGTCKKETVYTINNQYNGVIRWPITF